MSELTVCWFLLLITNRRREYIYIYCDGRVKNFNFINSFLHESLLLQPSIILSKFLCNLKLFAPSEEQQSTIHNGIEVGIVNHSQGFV